MREQSGRRIAALGIEGEVPEWLPLLSESDVAYLRPVEQAVARTHAIAAALAVQEGAPAEAVAAEVRRHDLERWLAGPERDVLRHHLGEAPLAGDDLVIAEANLGWQQECLWALLWALGIVEELRADAFCGDASHYRRLSPTGRPGDTVPGVALRPHEELAAELDFLYCLHWHARERRLRGHPQVAEDPLREGMVEERRRPIEWLFTEEEWEEISLDT